MARVRHVTAHLTPAAAADSPSTGRPRRQVSLTAPSLHPLLSAEHQEAVDALSALLVEATTEAGASPPSRAPQDRTATILDALSVPDATMPNRRLAQRHPAA